MGEDVPHSPLPATLPIRERKYQIPRCSKEEKVIPPILKFVGTRFDALVEATTQVSATQEPVQTEEQIEEVVMDVSPIEPS